MKQVGMCYQYRSSYTLGQLSDEDSERSGKMGRRQEERRQQHGYAGY
jgi:hypothetical protein